MYKFACKYVVAAVLFGAFAANTWAAGWTGLWLPLGGDVSVSIARVAGTANTWTWQFRNDGDATITSINFEYKDKDGDHSDVMPVSLKRGETCGGWSAFTANSRPTITIDQITRIASHDHSNT